VSKLSINLKEILSSAHENFEEQIRSWRPPQLLLIIALMLLLLLLLMHFMIISRNTYYIILYFNTVLEECDEEENVEVTGAVTTSCLKIRL
jgi:flagellar biosynthesis/type III secretory pathway M-ring protein FliF/YscJ